MWDALISWEFTNAVKVGDSEMVVLVLKTWALSFWENGWTKYAYKMLHLIHYLTKIWPKAISNIVLKNWLLNPTGHHDSFVKIDLVQEHLNFWVKVSITKDSHWTVLASRAQTAYKAHGSNTSWEWLTILTLTIEVLKRISMIPWVWIKELGMHLQILQMTSQHWWRVWTRIMYIVFRKEGSWARIQVELSRTSYWQGYTILWSVRSQHEPLILARATCQFPRFMLCLALSLSNVN